MLDRISRFCNSHVITTVNVFTEEIDLDSMSYVPYRLPMLCRCLNCGADGEDHGENGVCAPYRYIHMLTHQDTDHAFFEYYLKETDKRERYLWNEIL